MTDEEKEELREMLAEVVEEALADGEYQETVFTEDDRRRLELIEQTVVANSDKLDLLLNMLAEQEE